MAGWIVCWLSPNHRLHERGWQRLCSGASSVRIPMHKHFAVLLWEVTQKHLLWPTKTPACDFHELLVQMLLRLSGHFHPVSLFSIYHNRLTPPIWSPFGSSDSTCTVTKPCSSSSGLLFLSPEGRFCLTRAAPAAGSRPHPPSLADVFTLPPGRRRFSEPSQCDEKLKDQTHS